MSGLNPTFRDAALAKKAGLPPPVARAPAPRAMPRTNTDPRHLLGEARKLFAMATAERAEAARVLADARAEAELILSGARAAPPAEHLLPSPAAILREVADRHGVSLASILGQGRAAELVAARHEAVALVHAARPDLSLPALGRIFKRDHTSILNALRRAKARAG
jgi:chromosomal replication initiation ATPase DnaA